VRSHGGAKEASQLGWSHDAADLAAQVDRNLVGPFEMASDHRAGGGDGGPSLGVGEFEQRLPRSRETVVPVRGGGDGDRCDQGGGGEDDSANAAPRPLGWARFGSGRSLFRATFVEQRLPSHFTPHLIML
jgi:hypothetical protein